MKSSILMDLFCLQFDCYLIKMEAFPVTEFFVTDDTIFFCNPYAGDFYSHT
jgi:hypothetical protein